MLAIYVRVSRKRDGMVSPDVQLERGIQFAKENRIEYREYRDIDVSGGAEIEDRPQFREMLFEIDKKSSKIDAVYAYDPSRLYRSESTKITFLNIVAKRDIDVYFSGKKFDWSDPHEKLIHNIFTNVNQFQIDLTKDKIKSALDHNARQGKWKGIYPYGYKRGEDGKIEIDQEEAEIVKRIYARSLQGLGCRKIAELFNEEEIPTRYNKIDGNYTAVDNVRDTRRKKRGSEAKWRDKTVRGIIKNTLYKGERIYNKEIYKIPPIFKPAYWEKVNDHLKQNRNTQHGNAKKYDYLLRGLMICGVCGKNYHGRVNKSDNFYMCTSKRFPKENCGNRGINRPFIEEFVWSKFFLSGEFDKHLKEYFIEQSDQSKLGVLRRREDKLNKDLSKLLKQAQEARKYLYDGVITPEMYKEDVKDIQHEENKVRDRKSETESELSALENINQTQKGVKDDLKAMSEKLSFERKKEFIAKYLDYIEVDYYGKIYYLKFYFKLPQMHPQLYYVEPNYTIGFNITHQPVVDEVDSDDYEFDWEKVYGTMVFVRSYWRKAAENIRKGTPGKFPYKPNARKVYLEVKKMEQEEKVRG